MKFVFTYDISNPKKLSKVAKILENHGIRTQYSVFEVDFSIKEAKKLFLELEQIIDKDTDRIFAIPISELHRVYRFGKISNIGGVV